MNKKENSTSFDISEEEYLFQYQRLHKAGKIAAINQLDKTYSDVAKKAFSASDIAQKDAVCSPLVLISAPIIKSIHFTHSKSYVRKHKYIINKPEYLELDQNDDDSFFLHPIISNSSLMTEARIHDMLSYLIGKDKIPHHYLKYLRDNIPYKSVFNSITCRYQRSYDKNKLWNFFQTFPELRGAIIHRKIKSLEELEYYAAEYFS